MAKKPYRIARQEHLGEMLDKLQASGLLKWQWDYEGSSAVYWVKEPAQPRRKLSTKQAEELVLDLCAQQNLVWLPVPPPGGEEQRAKTLRKMAELRGVPRAEPTSEAHVDAIQATPFDLTKYPGLEQRLHDQPTNNRSAQTYGVARHCVELGLQDGEIKWFLAQYRPFLDKFGLRAGAGRELDRVVSRARQDMSS